MKTLKIANREKTLQFLRDAFAEAQTGSYKRGVSTPKILAHLGTKVSKTSAGAFKQKIKELFVKNEIPFKMKTAYGWVPVDTQQELNFNSEKQPEVVEHQKSLFGKSKDEVLSFLEKTISSPSKKGVTAGEICLWAGVEFTSAARQQIKDFILSNGIPWESHRPYGYVKISEDLASHQKNEKSKVDSAVTEMERSNVPDVAIAMQNSDPRIELTYEVLRQHQALCLAIIDKIWAPR